MFLQLSAVHHLQSAFDEASSCSRYHPSKGYSWDLKNGKSVASKKEAPVREEPGSLFQRHRVDMLLAELTRKFPLSAPKPAHQPPAESGNLQYAVIYLLRNFQLFLIILAVTVKQEKTDKKDMQPPPEKKPRTAV